MWREIEFNNHAKHQTHSGGRITQRAPVPGTVRDAFRIRPLPLQWFRGFGSAICAGLPVLIGVLMGHLDLGLCASMGGFAFLYVGNETYRQRAIKLLFVALGLAVSFGLGILSGSTPWLMVLLFGFIGAAAIFCFGVFQIAGPTAMFFIVTFSVGTSLPLDLPGLPLRIGMVLLGGMLAWIVGMAGWLFSPHGPETKAVSGAYRSLAVFLESMGTDHHHESRYQAASALRLADSAISGGELRWRRNYEPTKRLMGLTRKANEIFLTLIGISLERQATMRPELVSSIRSIADDIKSSGDKLQFRKMSMESTNEHLQQLCRQISEAVDILVSRNGYEANQEAALLPPNRLRLIVSGAFNRHSTLLSSALRYGIMIAAAAVVAYSLDLHRSYWVPLSCSAVMLGTTVLGTMHRALQRTVGTIIGLLIGGCILSFRPEGIYIALLMGTLQFIIELIYLRNYAIAVMFITPSSLLLAESSHPDLAISYFMSARIVDILIGSAIGLAGVYLLWRRASSSRLPHVLAKVIRLEGKLLEQVLTAPSGEASLRPADLETALMRLRLLYDAAFAESVRRKREVSSLWPAVVAVHHVGYVLIAAAGNGRIQSEHHETLMILKDNFENMAQAAQRKIPPEAMIFPHLASIPALQQEIIELHDALQTGESTAREELKTE